MPKQDDLSQSRSSRGTKSIDSWSDKWENVGDANARSSKGDAPQDDSKRMEEMKKEMVEIKFPGKRKSMRGPKDTAPSSYHNS